MSTYRACYWTDEEGGEIRLTGPEHANMPDDELVATARANADADLDLSRGRLVIGDWTD